MNFRIKLSSNQFREPDHIRDLMHLLMTLNLKNMDDDDIELAIMRKFLDHDVYVETLEELDDSLYISITGPKICLTMMYEDEG